MHQLCSQASQSFGRRYYGRILERKPLQRGEPV
jgi:hypothetical protein